MPARFVFAWLLSASSAVFGQQSQTETVDATIDEIVVLETRLADSRFDISENLSLDENALDNIRPSDPEQLFAEFPGIAVSRPGGPGGVSEFFLRGAESNFTVVYVDGVRLNNSANTRGGSYDVSLLSAMDVGRVDVTSGAMSAVHGADAMAGVIRIHSAWPDAGSSRILFEGGTVDDWRLGASTTARPFDGVEWNVRASALDAGNEIEGSSLHLKTVASRLAGATGDGSWEVGARFSERRRSSFPEVSGGPEFAASRETERADGDEFSLAASGRWRISTRWSVEVGASAARIRDDLDVPAVAPGVLDGQPAFTSVTDYERTHVSFVNRIELSDSLELVAGVGHAGEKGSDAGSVDFGFAVLPNDFDLQRNIASLFAELGKSWSNDVSLAIAARFDDFDDGRRVSGKAGISKQLSGDAGRLWARAASGFKLPSFFALGNPLFGNPDLAAEKVRSYEVGYTRALGSTGSFVITLFDNRYENLVDFDFETFSNVNRGAIDVEGVEVRADFVLTSSIGVSIDATWSDISSASGPLRRRPENLGGLSLDWAITDRWQLRARARYVGSRLTTSIPTGDVTDDGYALFGGTLTFRPDDARSAWLAIDNAFDDSYQDAPGFPAPGTRVRLGASFEF